MRRGRVPPAVTLLVPVLALALVLGWALGWWGDTPAPALGPEDGAGPPRVGSAPPEPAGLSLPAPAELAPAQRIAVAGPADARLVPLAADPWQKHVVEVKVPPGAASTGQEVLAAIGTRLYVRAQSAEDLEALGKQRVPVPQGAVPLPMLVRRLEDAGWRVMVRDPVLLLARGSASQPNAHRPR